MKAQKKFYATKTYDHSVGLSSCFRQWKAKSHCRFLHGYALNIKLVFGSETLDINNWVIDFGGLKEIKQWLTDTFDHKTLVAQDDPELDTFKDLHNLKIIDLKIIPATGCEKFAEYIFDYITTWLSNIGSEAIIECVEVREHTGNSGICELQGHIASERRK